MKKDQKTVGRESDKFMLRLPDGMRDRIAAAAKENNRSANSEIVARLEHSFEADDLLTPLAVAISRLNVNLSIAELDVETQRAHVAKLVLRLKYVAERLANPSDDNAPDILATVNKWLDEAKEFTADIKDLYARSAEKLSQLEMARNDFEELTKHTNTTVVSESPAEKPSLKRRKRRINLE